MKSYKLLIIFGSLFIGCVTPRNISSDFSKFQTELNNELNNQECSVKILNSIDQFFYKSTEELDTVKINSSISTIKQKFGLKVKNDSTGKSYSTLNCENLKCQNCEKVIWALDMAKYSKKYKNYSLKKKVEVWSNTNKTFDTNSIDISYYLRNHLIRTNTNKKIIRLYKKLKEEDKKFLLGSINKFEGRIHSHIDSIRINCRYFER